LASKPNPYEPEQLSSGPSQLLLGVGLTVRVESPL